jgi:DnaA regulatory inactivator Hda
MTASPHAQLPLDFDLRPSLSGEDFLVAASNAEAIAWLDRWPDWPATGIVIHGPTGCGKSHLAEVFMARSGAPRLSAEALVAGDPVSLTIDAQAWVIDDADEVVAAVAEETVFHLFNAVAASGGRLLMTAAGPPARWGVELPDLRSRLLTLPTAGIGQPDDILIEAVLLKHFADRQLRIESDVLAFILARMERSFAGARRVAAAVDAAALAEHRNITVPFVRRLIDAMDTATE